MLREARVGSHRVSKLGDRAVEAKLGAAARLSGRERERAVARLALELQHDLVPAAAISTTEARTFFSARIGCQTYQPIWGIVLGALCLRR